MDDIPGGVVSSFIQGGVQTRSEFVPLYVGHESKDWEGAALYRIRTDPPTPVTLHLGEGNDPDSIYGHGCRNSTGWR